MFTRSRFAGWPVLFVLLMLGACSPSPYKAANRSYRKQVKALAKELTAMPGKQHTASQWVGTVNLNLRKPNIVVLHYTAQNSCAETLKTFTLTRTQVSAHYVICRDGAVHHMLNDYLRAWHAGAGSWGNITDVNSSSIGIEIDNNGTEPFSNAQLTSLIQLLTHLKTTYNIPAANFVGHSDVAPGRKTDPGTRFPWKDLAAAGFGRWYGDTTQLKVQKDFNEVQALRIIGYSVKDIAAARKAFALHYLQDASGAWTDRHRKVLYALLQQW